MSSTLPRKPTGLQRGFGPRIPGALEGVGVTCDVNGCQFCEEFAVGASTVLPTPMRRIVFEDDAFAVVAAIGSFVPGYLLILPKRHHQSFAALDALAFGEALTIVGVLRSRIGPVFGDAVLFEHGSHGAKSGGACLDHAHWHLVPSCGRAHLLADFAEAVPLGRSADLRDYRFAPYLYAQDAGASGYVVPNPTVRSQYFRRKLAGQLGVDDLWDWGSYFGVSEMRLTLELFGTAPEQSSSVEVTSTIRLSNA